MIVGIGVDIIEHLRMARALDRGGQAFLDRVFSPAEQSYCRGRARAVSCFANRLAAKEALAKASRLGIFGLGGLAGTEVVNDRDGAPRLILSEAAATAIAGRFGDPFRCSLSLSDSQSSSVAMVVLEVP
jgi:holo-[acyl-carrier protein] synthase